MMKDTEALEILRAQGHAASIPDVRTGRVRVWIRATDEAVDVQLGKELHDLAEGKLSFEDIRAEREQEVAAWTE